MKYGELRHSAAHVLAAAVKRLFPNVKLAIGPAIEEGFYYDFENKKPFIPEDLEKIEKEMKKIIKENLLFKRIKKTRKEAENILRDEPYKLELLKDIPDDNIFFYSNGDFIDLCAGPHVKTTKDVKAVKLLKIAGAYWKGDSKNKQLQRIYGIAFPSKKELDDFLKNIKEAEKRDHRKIGKQMELFSIHGEAPGMAFFHGNGNFIWDKLSEFMIFEMEKLGYEMNRTPIILNKELWLKSGHWDHYKENMYFTKIEGADYAVKPMNCPGNILIFKNRLHSYRELPIKAGEFGIVHRHELSGVLSGLFRVRAFTQDDAHIFCTEEQVKDQIIELINLTDKVYSVFGFDYDVELSTMPTEAMGTLKMWKTAEKALSEALKTRKIKFTINEGEGAFYGPKIDFHVKDALGRSWQCGTIQLDFSMPEKFDLTYENIDGRKHRPVMIHRTIYGSFERFIGILIEHYAGKFPLWLSPVQIKILTLTDKNKKYGKEVYEKFKKEGLRVVLDDRSESMGRKVRDAQLSNFNYIITVGDKEQKNKTLAVRTLDGKVKFGVKINSFLKKVLDEIDRKE
ncbi:MAG: threonine--tRNA ligase [Candidatus Woesearchaeota archaeon]